MSARVLKAVPIPPDQLERYDSLIREAIQLEGEKCSKQSEAQGILRDLIGPCDVKFSMYNYTTIELTGDKKSVVLMERGC